MKEIIRTEYVIEKDGLYYNDHNNTVKWFDSPFYVDSVFVDKRTVEKFAEEYNVNVRKFIITAEVEENWYNGNEQRWYFKKNYGWEEL